MTNPDRVAFNLLGRDIYWYGILMAAGILLALWFAAKEGKRKALYKDAILDMAIIAIPCGVVGARLYYVLFELDSYLKDPISILYLWEGGLAIYGAIIGGLIGILLFAKRKNIRFLKLADCIAPGLALAQSIGRWGNFFNQEAYGLPVTAQMLEKFPFLSMFPFAVKIDVPWRGGYHTFNGLECPNPIHLATFFYESVWCLLVFVFIWLRRKKFKHDGDAFLTYAALYAFERMFVEGLRGDSLWLIRPDSVEWLSGGIRVSQLISFLLLLGIGTFMLIRHMKEKQTGQLMWPAPEESTETEGEEGGEAAAAESEEQSADEAAEGEESGAGAAKGETNPEPAPAQEQAEPEAQAEQAQAEPDAGGQQHAEDGQSEEKGE